MQTSVGNDNFYGFSNPQKLAAKYGTPLYVYNEKVLRKCCQDIMSIAKSAGMEASYSVKANSNPALLAIIREEGFHADAMSPGELEMDKLAGWQAEDVFYISNNIAPAEMLEAIRQGCLVSVDSLSQLEMFGLIANALNKKPCCFQKDREDAACGYRVMVRMNPGIGAGHSDKVVTGGSKTKFGVSLEKLPDLLKLLKEYNLTLAGLNQHIGSLFLEPEPYLEAAKILLHFAGELPEHIFKHLEYLDFGGGFGISYHKEGQSLDLEATAAGLKNLLEPWRARSAYAGKFLMEPGRYVVAQCGKLLGQVTSVKENAGINYAGTDLGFNVLMRPVLYDAYHEIETYGAEGEPIPQTITGNICESGDILAKNRMLPPLSPGNLIIVADTGAYGFSMASNYNERLLPAEILIQADGHERLIRRRQTIDDLKTCLEGMGAN